MSEFSTPEYEHVRDLGCGTFGTACLMEESATGELVAVKFLERGDKIDENVRREIVNHSMLSHPHIIGFRKVFLTPSHLGIVMEDADGGELFERVAKGGQVSEDEARNYFQQLIAGVDFMHKSKIVHRDIKLENLLLHGPEAALKICDFGYSKSGYDSMPKSMVGTPAYIAPEVLRKMKYDGELADVWSCGVTLYVMLVGHYPFEDSREPANFRKTMQRILNVKYSFPPHIHISVDCMHLIQKIFVADPERRISIAQLKQHKWVVKDLPDGLFDHEPPKEPKLKGQTVEELESIVREAQTQPGLRKIDFSDFETEFVEGNNDDDDEEEEDAEET